MKRKMFSTWAIALTLIAFNMVSAARGQSTATFLRANDALPGRCYDWATSVADGNRLKIGINTGVSAQTFQSNACVASTAAFNPIVTMDTISFYVQAPAGYVISTITFSQTGGTDGSNGGRGFRGATWVVDDSAFTVDETPGGWLSSLDLLAIQKSVIPISITTYLAAFGVGATLTGSASASDPVLTVELAPIQ